ncbi:MAG TPA: TetR/AcrR family transcriptional regulator [Thermoleophilaceae bacterium]|jgi:AcrR family transcriptional regulator
MPKVTQEHLDARRRQILDAALTCFAREGFHRTTMQDIFGEAGLSPGAVYSYFKSKDEIIDAITREAARFAETGGTMIRENAEELTLAGAVAALAHGFEQLDVGTAETRARMVPQLWVEAQRNSIVRDRARVGIGGAVEGLTEVARAAQERGDLDPELDPEAAARVAISVFQGLLVQRSIFGADVDVDAYVEAALLMLGPRA